MNLNQREMCTQAIKVRIWEAFEAHQPELIEHFWFIHSFIYSFNNYYWVLGIDIYLEHLFCSEQVNANLPSKSEEAERPKKEADKSTCLERNI